MSFTSATFGHFRKHSSKLCRCVFALLGLVKRMSRNDLDKRIKESGMHMHPGLETLIGKGCTVDYQVNTVSREFVNDAAALFC